MTPLSADDLARLREDVIDAARVAAVGWDDARVNGLKGAVLERVLSSVKRLHDAVTALDAALSAEPASTD